MKKLSFVTVIIVFLLIISNGIQGQTTQTQIDQVKLMQQYGGIWQTVLNKGTTEIVESQQYGNISFDNVYLLVNGKRSLQNVNVYCYSPNDGKYKGFTAMANGTNMTFFGSFVTDKKFAIDIVQNFNPETVFMKMEVNYETLKSMTITSFNPNDVKTGEHKFTKVK